LADKELESFQRETAFVVVPVLLVLVTAAACYIPVRRASMVDPWWLCATNDAGDESVGSVMLVVS
jgi:hypothetical protein